MTSSSLVVAVTKVLWPEGLNSRYYLDVNTVSRHSAWAHGFMHDYALWLGLVLMTLTFIAAYAVVWWRRDLRAAALLGLGGVGTLVALGLNQVVGHAAQELRPYDTYPHALVLVAKANDYAFPSDHAVVAGALLASVLLVVRRAPGGSHRAMFTRGWRSRRASPAMVVLATAAAVLCLFLCFARVYVGAHYPGDVVAGALLGAAIVLVVSAARPAAYWIADLVEGTFLAVVVSRPEARGWSERGAHVLEEKPLASRKQDD